MIDILYISSDILSALSCVGVFTGKLQAHRFKSDNCNSSVKSSL